MAKNDEQAKPEPTVKPPPSTAWIGMEQVKGSRKDKPTPTTRPRQHGR